jgi:hypothetical protein
VNSQLNTVETDDTVHCMMGHSTSEVSNDTGALLNDMICSLSLRLNVRLSVCFSVIVLGYSTATSKYSDSLCSVRIHVCEIVSYM